ncbi:MAG: hypothetical protein QOF89_2543 [Acidobacteriota bacterium]|jgi:hypothetical protein|nr:hypothetical protein [Acidobacteriota bacterium]
MKSTIVALLLSMSALSVTAQEPTPVNPPPAVPPAVATPPQAAAPAQMGASAQEGEPRDYSVDVHRLSVAPQIDGKLDDTVWQEGSLLGNFIQIEPETGKPATQQTEVRMGYDSRNLYFGIRCYDSQPNRLLMGSRSPDANLAADDSISIVLDTFHDRRNGFLFTVNPIGAKTDALIRNEGEDINTDWDGLWEGVTVRDAQGWTAEIAIPFKTLRFSSSKDPQTWGFNVRRFVARTQESSVWKPIRRRPGGLAPWSISEYGEIQGLSDLGTGGHYQFVPYAIARAGREYRADTHGTGDAGGDLKINLTSELVADLTVHTDFAEVEADQQQINLERFKLFYPEQRQFFLEGANLFYFGDRPEPFAVPEKFYFFFSRQIGLAEDGRVVVPVIGGGKVTGRVGDTSVGFLNMTTESTSYFTGTGRRIDEPRTNFTVLRLKQQVFGSSTIGLIGLNKDPDGSEYNRGAGFDWDLHLGGKWYSAGYAAQTDTPGVDGRESAYSGDLVYKGSRLRLRHRYTNIGDNFNPEMGFLTRSGIIKNHSNVFSSFNVANNPLHLHKVILVADSNHVADQRDNLQTQLTTYELGLSASTGAGVAFLYYDDLEDLDLPLPVTKKATIPAGHYRFRSLFTGISSGYTHRLGFTFWYHDGGYYGGDRLRTFLSVIYRPFDGLVIAPSFDRVRVDAPWGNFVTKIAQLSVDYSLSTTLSTRLTLQRQPGDNYRANFIIDWMYRPGSDFYLVYNDIQDLNDPRRNSGFSTLSPGRTFVAKMTRRFDF